MKRMRFDLRTGLIWAAVLVGTIWATNVCAQEAAPGEAAPAVPEVVLAEAVRTPEEAASAARDSAANLAEELAMRLETDRENAPLWLELGHAYLLAGEPKRAEKAFKQAQKKADGNKQTMAQAFNGLGLAYTARGRRLQSAVEFFKKALRRDPSYIEAHYNLARAYYKHNWLTHAIRAARDAVAVDSTYTPALQLIELCRAVRTGDKQVSKASYEKFLEKDPDNHATWLEWGKVALAEGEYGDILKRLVPMVRRHRDWLELYPLVAQAYWKVNLPEKGWIVFNDYIDGLDEEGKALYRDFRLVTTKETANAYGKASSEDQKKMAARFWAERDPDYTTEVNERQLEHFRRVWFARTYFSKNANPWDRRGEVYIRYGEPDHRSRSINPTPPPTHSVSAVKERYYDMIYSDQHIILAMGGGGPSSEPARTPPRRKTPAPWKRTRERCFESRTSTVWWAVRWARSWGRFFLSDLTRKSRSTASISPWDRRT